MSNSKKQRAKRSANKDGSQLTNKQLQKEILHLFRMNPEMRFTPKQIIQRLELKNNKDAVRYAIEQLQQNGKLKTVPLLKLTDDRSSKPDRNRRKQEDEEAISQNKPDFQSNSSSGKGFSKPASDESIADDELIGTVDLSRSGSGYVVVEGREQDVFIPQRRLSGAMNGDTVRIRVWTPRGRNKPEGEVVEVTNRKVEFFLGSFRDGRKYGVVIPDRIEYEFDVAVMPNNAGGAKDGDKVVVKVTDWPERAGQNPRGVITQVLGATGSIDIEMMGILINQGFELNHSTEAMQEAEAVSDVVTPEDLENRLDLRDVLTFTIDPYDAKDFDDAISYRELDNGRIEIGVHIADVSHFVRPGTALDDEAAKSTTSVYLVDRVLPMLPEKLSNGVCSLRPNEDKFTFSAMFEFDEKFVIRKTYFSKTLTHSDRRFTYEEAQELIDADLKAFKASGDAEAKWTEIIQQVNTISLKLRANRFKNGSIDFDSDEVRFKLAEDGTPIDAYVKERIAANMLIEDFMLLANRSVAEFISKKGAKLEIPFPYRVHDEPDPDKMANLATFAAQFGIDLDLSSPKSIAKSYNRLTKLAAEREELAVLSPLAIRTMAKAEYTTENIGHYGLAFEHYGHFTSPIRRYADVLTHRILVKNLGKTDYRMDKESLEEQCKHISERERAATKCERESTSYFQVLYIKDHIGEEFDGKVNGVIDRGVFVQLTDNYCEGFVPFETMTDRFELGENRLVATGRKSGLKLQMGTKIRVQIVSAEPDTRRIEMALVEEEKKSNSTPSSKKPDTRTKKENKTPRRAKKKTTNVASKANSNGQAKGAKRGVRKPKS